jgi:hypothetical protein
MEWTDDDSKPEYGRYGPRDSDLGAEHHKLATDHAAAASQHADRAKALADQASQAEADGNHDQAVSLLAEARQERDQADNDAGEAEEWSKSASWHKGNWFSGDDDDELTPGEEARRQANAARDHVGEADSNVKP